MYMRFLDFKYQNKTILRKYNIFRETPYLLHMWMTCSSYNISGDSSLLYLCTEQTQPCCNSGLVGTISRGQRSLLGICSECKQSSQELSIMILVCDVDTCKLEWDHQNHFTQATNWQSDGKNFQSLLTWSEFKSVTSQ